MLYVLENPSAIASVASRAQFLQFMNARAAQWRDQLTQSHTYWKFLIFTLPLDIKFQLIELIVWSILTWIYLSSKSARLV